MGFPLTFIHWISFCVLQGYSRIIVNGLAGKKITLKRGVRQGDPLSPYLFILGMDFLSRWFVSLHQDGLLSLPFPNIQPCLLFADDALFFFRPSLAQSQTLKIFFAVFHQISGLKINPSKSELLCLNTDRRLMETCADILQCQPKIFPITYLGLPLSNKKLTRDDYKPLLQRFSSKLNSWSSSLLSMTGRLVLVNSCLTSLPVFFMSVFRLPKWVIQSLDSIRRTFLWQGSSNSSRKLVTVSWKKVCSPKKLGGLGVLDLDSFNLAHLAKWLWKWSISTVSNWKSLVRTLQMSHAILPLNSPLTKALTEILPLFNSITVSTVNSSTSVFFWHQNWGLGILSSFFHVLFSYCLNPDILVSEFLTNLQDPLILFRPSLPSSSLACIQLQQLTQALSLLVLRPHSSTYTLPDQLHLKTSTNQFTPSYVYNFINLFPKVNSDIYQIWSLKAPPRVLTFVWLLLHNKLTTIDNLQLRGLTMVNRCSLCQLACESSSHLVNHCSFFLETKIHAFNALSLTLRSSAPTQSLLVDKLLPKKFRGILAITCYFTWRERCSRIFRDRLNSPLSTALKFWTNGGF
ncbi:RNA-directed DNA polymerase (reverse transcriptase)-related family protein [Rhynchospora pubera]|uniref:RNA-directed DNA polymerase (Reverse transcriptase)-related family protein n=1 Tax=Rhynchospora pubera TaxID=906938 RepID=A0AAV8D592_9POAL|nr:RNA-directed DNA polymerase (reverse transcriptase)-related family protein [Rhynchospora pubera]